MRKNDYLSEKYGLHIYNSRNPNYPYYVQEWDGCYTEEEIAHPEQISDWADYCPTCPNFEVDVDLDVVC